MLNNFYRHNSPLWSEIWIHLPTSLQRKQTFKLLVISLSSIPPLPQTHCSLTCTRITPTTHNMLSMLTSTHPKQYLYSNYEDFKPDDHNLIKFSPVTLLFQNPVHEALYTRGQNNKMIVTRVYILLWIIFCSIVNAKYVHKTLNVI